MKRFLAYITAVLVSLACTSNIQKEYSGMDPSLEGKPVMVTFSIPDVCLQASTKGIEGSDGKIADEPYLDPERLYLVVCGHSQSIKYIRKAEWVSTTTNVPITDIPDYPLSDGTQSVTLYKFRVQLELSDSDRTIHFLGNIDEQWLNTGSYSYQLLPTLMSYEGKQAYWQKVYLESIHPKLDGNNNPITQNGFYVPDEPTASSLSCVPLIRNYAKIQVVDATAEEDEFELFSYAVIYYPKTGSVVPYRSNAGSEEDPFSFSVPSSSYRFSGYERCSFSTLDEDLGYLGNMSPSIVYDQTIPDASLFEHPENSNGRVIKYNKDNPEQGFHIYERCIPDSKIKPSYVIIRGKFGDGEEYYYYRLDLMESKVVNYESVYQYYPIYRNFRYTIRLNRISSVGVSSPEAAANSSGAEDISADISMQHLSDISNGHTRLVVEPFMSKIYSGPSEEGYYYLYARFFNDINSAEPNTDWGAVSVELESMGDQEEDILILYDDVGNEVHGFYPSSQIMGGEAGFRIIRFNTKEAGNETKTQKIKITGRNLYTHEEFPLYREVEITLQKKQTMIASCSNPELSLQKGAKQELRVSIPDGLPSTMFPLEFTIEAELPTLTPDTSVPGNNLPVASGISISENVEYSGKNTIQFIRTLTWDEYEGLTELDGFRTFSSYFKTNRNKSATTIWVDNDYFKKTYTTFTNLDEVSGHFWIKINENADTTCNVVINQDYMEYNVDQTGWLPYTSNDPIELERGHVVAFRSTTTITDWESHNGNSVRIFCYKAGSAKTDRDGQFSVGGNIASLIMGDSFISEAVTYTGAYSFVDLFKYHVNLTDASELILPMQKCQSSCYKSLFDSCTGLKSGPAELPATSLANACYRNMFFGCANLEDAPYIAAENPADACYQRMFSGCSSLRLIKINCKTYNASDFQKNGEVSWTSGVPSDGEIWLNPAIKTSTNFENIIPKSGTTWIWTVKKLPDGDPWTY